MDHPTGTDPLTGIDPSTGTDPQILHKTLVLQPRGCLDQKQGLAFQATLEQALQQATQAVIVDLLWVEAIDQTGLQVLKAGMQLAADLGRVLSFQPMNIAVLANLEQERTILTGNQLDWAEVWHEDLDVFLCRRMSERMGTLKPEPDCIAPLENCVTSPSENRFAPPADYICPPIIYPPIIEGQRTA